MTEVQPGRLAAATFQAQLAAATLVPWVAIVVMHVGGWSDDALLWLVLSLAVGTTHVGTTAALYFDAEMRPALRAGIVRYTVAPAALVAVGVLVATRPPLLSVAVALVGTWQIHHFTRQNVGVFAFVCRARRVPGPTDGERTMFAWTGYAGMLGLLPHFVGEAGGTATVLAATALAGAGVQAWRLGRDRDRVGRAALATAVLFYVPLVVFPGDLLAASAAYAFAHGAQYVVMMLHLAGGRDVRAGRRMTAAVVTCGLLVGAPLQWMSESPTAVLVGVQAGVVAAHFVVDAGVWRLRDPERRAYMQRRFAFL